LLIDSLFGWCLLFNAAVDNHSAFLPPYINYILSELCFFLITKKEESHSLATAAPFLLVHALADLFGGKKDNN